MIPFYLWSAGFHLVAAATFVGWGLMGSHPAKAPPSGSDGGPATIVVMGDPRPVLASDAARHEKDAVVDHQERHRELSRQALSPATEAVATVERSREPGKNKADAAASLPNAPGDSGWTLASRGGRAAHPYLANIRQMVERSKHYPPMSWKAGEEGEMTFRVHINAHGDVERMELLSHQATERLLAAGRYAIEKAGPFGPPPSPWREGIQVRIPLRFSIASNAGGF